MIEDQHVDIKENYIKLLNNNLLSILLKDRSSNKNIIWATDTYAEKGALYDSHEYITTKLITGRYGKIIRPRVDKSKREQKIRIKDKAEVFTPSWICNLMNNGLDETWFERKNIFNTPNELSWICNNNKIAFDKNNWEEYIKLKVIELSCGEAPFLCSRYDTTNGEWIEVNERIGLLDRKLRIVNENAETEKDWYNAVIESYKSVYGYEWQGDSLLIARENLLFTFIDFYIDRFGKNPDEDMLIEIAKIISWNIWQMDGLKYVIPNSCKPAPKRQMSLFQDEDTEPCQGCIKGDNNLHTGIYCKIMNWDTKRSIKFYKGEKRMKFDFVVGNPPYQETTAIKETENGQKTSKSIFHYFQISADAIAKKTTCMIYPAIRWIHRSGKGMNDFGVNQINDPRLKKLILYHNASEVFPTTEIGDGVSIVIKQQDKKEPGFDYVYKNGTEIIETKMANPKEELMVIYPKDNEISEKIGKFIETNKLKFLYESVLPRNLFGVESNAVELNPEKFEVYTQGADIKDNEVKVFTNDKAGKAGRAIWFVTDRSNIQNKDMISEWQVVVSSASPGGQKRNNQIEIIDNKSAFGRSRVALKSFKTKEEAQNFYQYATSSIIKYSMLLTDENLTSFAKKVPDILDYSDKNKFINFNQNVDEQLIKLFKITNDEYEYIKKRLSKN